MNKETPKLAVDCIVRAPSTTGEKGIILIKRKYPPLGCALPGGFVDVGESTEHAAVREMKEELNLDVKLVRLVGVYSNPDRDPRQHVVSVVYEAFADKPPVAGDDAKEASVWEAGVEPMPKMVFDHEQILNDYFEQD